MRDTSKMLEEMAAAFGEKIPDDFALKVQFDFETEGQTWCVAVEQGKKITPEHKACHDPDITFRMKPEVLHKIYSGELTAMTAAGQATGADPAPLRVEFPQDREMTEASVGRFLFFVQRFFSSSKIERTILDEAHSRVVHGANVVPLYYHTGFRSGWYLIKKGQRLNEPGDTNPYPQAFVFVRGEGFAKIGDAMLNVKAGESYYIPPGSDHIVWTESDRPLELIWLAWGEGA